MTASPAALSIDLAAGRAAFLGALDSFVRAVASQEDLALLTASRCHGWARLEVVVHVRVGLEEMLAGMPATSEAAPTVDAASYWTTWEEADREDPVPGILWTRRTASAYARPRGALEHLETIARGLRRAAEHLGDGALDFQDHVIASGDFLATWAVELTVHHLDLDLPADAPAPDPDALALARRTVAAIAPESASAAAATSEADAILRGFGRA